MRNKWFVSASVLCAVGLVAGTALAAPFDPAFRIDRVKGACQVSLPGSAVFTDAESGKAYPFGTQVVSGDGATFSVILSALNEAAAGPNTRLSVTAAEDETTPRRTIHVESGRIDVELEPDYEQANALDVESHCNSLTALTGGKFSVEVRTEEDLVGVVIASVSATLRIVGPQFTIEQIEREQSLSVACSQDRSYIRVKALDGQYPIMVQNSEGEMTSIPMEPGSVVKILQRKSETGETLVVTILAIGPDGTILPDGSFTYETGEGVMPPGPMPPVVPTTQPPAVPPPTQPGEWPPWASTTTTTTTTTTQPTPEKHVPPPPPPAPTTTTRPSPTPVGRR